MTNIQDAVMEEEPSDDGKGFRLFEETDDGEKRILGPRLSPETTLVVLDWLKHQNRSDA